MSTPQPLIVGNWKMHPATTKEAIDLTRAVSKIKVPSTVTVAVAPPFVFLSEAGKLLKKKAIALAAQDMFYERLGAATGEISPLMLKDLGTSYVIIGHSERRALGETDDEVNQKLLLALQLKLTPIVCVGERNRDGAGDYFATVETQVRQALTTIPKSKLKDIVIAYEPIWAIGTGNTATPQDAEEMKLFIQKVLIDMFGRAAGRKVRILYGGSVKAANAAALFAEGDVDGFLVGGASLDATEFTNIIKAVS